MAYWEDELEATMILGRPPVDYEETMMALTEDDEDWICSECGEDLEDCECDLDVYDDDDEEVDLDEEDD